MTLNPKSSSCSQAPNGRPKICAERRRAERLSAEAEAVNIERTADNIVQVLPLEVIRSLPNANMADALGRLPSVTLERDEGEGKYVQVRGTEPRLTNTTINGISVPSPEPGVRQIKFDAIPADLVESVQISKTLQANMEGDGIGGSVNLVTKTATERPTISLSGMAGYTPIVNGRSLTEEAGTIGQRFPDTDPRWKGVSSLVLLDDAMLAIEAAGWRVGNVDTVVTAEAPRLQPHLGDIAHTLAPHLRVTPESVGVKATSPEGLGALGRGEGIAAQAVVLLEGSG